MPSGTAAAQAFEAEIERRTPADVREHARELDRRAMAGEGTPEEARESMDLVWPAYFSAWEKAPPPFDIAIGVEAYAETMQSVTAELPGLAARLAEACACRPASSTGRSVRCR